MTDHSFLLLNRFISIAFTGVLLLNTIILVIVCRQQHWIRAIIGVLSWLIVAGVTVLALLHSLHPLVWVLPVGFGGLVVNTVLLLPFCRRGFQVLLSHRNQMTAATLRGEKDLIICGSLLAVLGIAAGYIMGSYLGR